MILDLIETLIKLTFYLSLILFLLCVAIKIRVVYKKVACTCPTRLDNKLVLITGGNSGIGYETAKRLAKHGARVVIASRNIDKSKEAAERIKQATGNPNVDVMHLDLCRLTAVKQFAEEFSKTYDRLDVLINNAGISDVHQLFTEDGIEKTIQANHIGPSYLTHLLLDKLVASKPSRIVFVGSDMYKFNTFDPEDLAGIVPLGFFSKYFAQYSNSKLCNILAAKALAKRLPDGVTANTVHPGATASEIWEHIPFEYPRKLMYMILRFICKSVEECSQDSVHVAIAASVANVSGQYFRDCNVISCIPQVTDELAERVWKDTIQLAENAVRNKINTNGKSR